MASVSWDASSTDSTTSAGVPDGTLTTASAVVERDVTVAEASVPLSASPFTALTKSGSSKSRDCDRSVFSFRLVSASTLNSLSCSLRRSELRSSTVHVSRPGQRMAMTASRMSWRTSSGSVAPLMNRDVSSVVVMMTSTFTSTPSGITARMPATTPSMASSTADELDRLSPKSSATVATTPSGDTLGVPLGSAVGMVDGSQDGAADGSADGSVLGSAVGTQDGSGDGT
mmetsp:Transcript_16361/g.62173  ORF Transcript_16361/g.62173 Transcript_16361/m.62173 type:complete len:228 (+) Transcript_16361:487-1170(+)